MSEEESNDMASVGLALQAGVEAGSPAGQAELARWAQDRADRWGLAYPALMLWASRGCALLDSVSPGRAWAAQASAGLDERAARLFSALLDSAGDSLRATAVLAAERDPDGASIAADLALHGWPRGVAGLLDTCDARDVWDIIAPAFALALAVMRQASLRHGSSDDAFGAAWYLRLDA